MLKAINRLTFISLGCLVVLGVLVFRHWEQAKGRRSTTFAAAVTNTVEPTPVTEPINRQRTGPAIQASLSELAKSMNSDASARTLARLRAILGRTSTDEASRSIGQFLASRADAPTQQGFRVGAGGFLDGSPTLRIFLLDYLSQIDAGAAADCARQILSHPDSPDEWAVALRCLAAGDGSNEGRAMLEQKTTALLSYEPWQQSPSAGYLEAFDVTVFLGSTNFANPLGSLIRRRDNPAIAHAAFLALDRLVIQNPTVWLSLLQEQPTLLEGRELTRADYFARADVRDAQQRMVLEKYLLSSPTNPREFEHFAEVFPNANYMISQNLLTRPALPEPSSLVARDEAALRVVQSWLEDPRFTEARPYLEKTQRRLETLVRQSAGK
jgi:hypothetical protein